MHPVYVQHEDRRLIDQCWCDTRVEKQKAAAAAQEKASLKPQQDAAGTSLPTPVSLAASDVANQLEDDLKQRKAAMAQQRLSELQGKAVTSAAATSSSSLISRIRLVQPSVSLSVLCCLVFLCSCSILCSMNIFVYCISYRLIQSPILNFFSSSVVAVE